MSLRIVPVRFADACGFVQMWHRHHQPPVGCKFCLGVADDNDVLRGVAIVGRPVARLFDDGMTLEVTRTATDGTPNANSKLYGATWRASRELGYRRLVTYTQQGETGSSLRAAGWRVVAERRPRPGWTVQEAADLLYLSPAAFYKRESGDCEPATLADIDRWAALFGKRVALVPANMASAATPRMFHAVVDPVVRPDTEASSSWMGTDRQRARMARDAS